MKSQISIALGRKDAITAAMMSIDAENETQRWQLKAYDGADTALVDRCR